MKIPKSLGVLLMVLAVSGCGLPPSGGNLSEYKNLDPRIEAIHVEAYNYDLGIGVPQDRAKANLLYLQAAKAGDPRSMMNYSINRYSGVGTEADPVDAYYWIDKARFATQHTADMKTKWRVRGVYDEMRKELTPEQIRKAKARR